MSNLSVSCNVNREGDPLPLENPGTFRVVYLGPGSILQRRNVVTSPFVHGETLIGTVREHARAILQVRVYGSTLTQVNERASELVAAFEQWRYQVWGTIDGAPYEWECEPADIALAEGSLEGAFEPNRLRARMQEYRISIPRHPLPVSGPL